MGVISNFLQNLIDGNPFGVPGTRLMNIFYTPSIRFELSVTCISELPLMPVMRVNDMSVTRPISFTECGFVRSSLHHQFVSVHYVSLICVSDASVKCVSDSCP